MATVKEERIDPIEVNILEDSDLPQGASIEYDLSEDWYAKSCPPPGRTELSKPRFYKVKAFIEADSWAKNLKQGYKTSDPNGWYYTSQIACKIQISDPKLQEFQDAMGYYRISTAVPKGKRMSSAMMVLRDLKIKVKPIMTDFEVANLLTKAINKLDGPEMIIDGDWQAWDKTKVDKRNQFGQVAICNNKVLSSMANFPKKADGSFEHICYTKEGLEVTASFKVLRLLPIVKKEAEKGGKETTKAAVPAPVKPKVLPPPPPEPEEVESTVEIGEDGEVVFDV